MNRLTKLWRKGRCGLIPLFLHVGIDKEKEVDNTPVEMEMLQVEDVASFVKGSLGIWEFFC